MAETAAQLVDHVVPMVPIRQLGSSARAM